MTVGYLGLIGALTLAPGPTSLGPSGPLWWLLTTLRRLPGTGWLTFDRFEFAANIAMFAPLGFFLTWWWGRRRSWYALLAGLAVSIAIEVSQRHIPGRVSDPRDVAANTLGTLVGIVVMALLGRWRRRADHRTDRGDDTRAQ